jgi:hypothetical protein
LLWSVRPKAGAQERKQLLTTLPDLLKRLRAGLEGLGLTDVWDPFFAQLIRLHVGALHNEAPPDLVGDPARAAAPAARTQPGTQAGLKTLGLVNLPSRIEYHRAPPVPAPAAPALGDDRDLGLVNGLGVGTWVEFEGFHGTRKTLRLNWVSQSRGVFLFTNRQGENAVTLATTSLAEHLRRGTARALSQAPLTDRAVAHLLQRATARAHP